jgi:hypothetical protein
MPIHVTCSRKGKAPKRRTLQQDDGLWTLCRRLEPVLAEAGGQRIEARAVRERLASLYGDVELREDPPGYELVWDPLSGQWRIICHETATITIEEGDPPLEIRFDACASYA